MSVIRELLAWESLPPAWNQFRNSIGARQRNRKSTATNFSGGFRDSELSRVQRTLSDVRGTRSTYRELFGRVPRSSKSSLNRSLTRHTWAVNLRAAPVTRRQSTSVGCETFRMTHKQSPTRLRTRDNAAAFLRNAGVRRLRSYRLRMAGIRPIDDIRRIPSAGLSGLNERGQPSCKRADQNDW